MDTKNVIAAISLSAAVIILYSLFFAPSPEEMKQNKIKQAEQLKTIPPKLTPYYKDKVKDYFQKRNE